MNKSGKWTLSPAYDVSFSYNPNGLWTSSHQMCVNGKRKNFIENDFETCAKIGNLSKKEISASINEVKSALLKWKDFATKAGLSEKRADEINSILKEGF